MRNRFRRREGHCVTAVRLALDFNGLDYRKWGDEQHAEPGDWLVDNGGDVYTVSAETFESTYQQESPGRWKKSASVWAVQATQSGSVSTQEGRTHYSAGDWLVSNDIEKKDAYAVSAEKFEDLYEPDPSDGTTEHQSNEESGS